MSVNSVHCIDVGMLKKIKTCITNEVEKMWSALSDIVEGDIEHFAKMLFGKSIITKGRRNSKDYNGMMDDFIATMGFFKNLQDYEEHCTNLLDTLTGIGAGVRKCGDQLKESLIEAVKREVGIEFLVHAQFI